LTSLYSFTNGTDGSLPLAGLAQGTDGNFYGTTEFSGTNGGGGTVFKISTNGVLTSLHSFDFNDGAYPLAGLAQGSDGAFYGTTSGGGITGNGTIFRLSVGLGVLRSVPAIQGVALTNGTLSLSWSATTGGVYQLQYTSDLNLDKWTSLDSPVIASGATLNTTALVTNSPQGFYRLALLP
jgi:uncharacterized repeat protein (TIGR03803 family)